MADKKFTITAALPYANGPLHLGHVAGVYLPSDIFARFARLNGDDVLFVCGSDEHGAAITLRAKKEGITPQEIVDKYHSIISTSFSKFNISFDIYHRTSSEVHHQTSQDFFKKLQERAKFIEETTDQYYDLEFNQFLADRYIIGTCPKCSYENAFGDQCEKCGSDLSPLDLINPISTLSGKQPVLKSTSHWYLPMDKHEDWLKEYIQKGIFDGQTHHNPKLWRNQVVGQCMSWINGGLKPRAMTRDLDWGVKVPLPNSEGKVLYVWLDAPIGYISATKAWAEKNKKDWKKYWVKSESEERKLVHFIGKDNIVFHAIIFPILLKDHGDFILPDNVPASEFLNLEGDKFSTSRNWAVWLHEYLENYPDKEDELKYVLTSIAPESKDSEFTWKEYQARINNELADILGNFINRTLVLTHKYYGGKVPACGALTETDKELINDIQQTPFRIAELIYAYKFREAQTEAMSLARLGNKYLADQEPWKLIKTDPERVKTILNLSIQITANLALVFQPFLPKTAIRLQTILGVTFSSWGYAGTTSLIAENHEINKPEILFAKIDDEFVYNEVNKLKNQNDETHEIYP